MLHAVENKITEPINLGSGTGVSIKQIVDIIVDKCEHDIQVEWDTSKPAGDKKRILICQEQTLMDLKIPSV